jgi:hypothetical protein
MRTQYHFWPGENGLDAWDVDRLIELTRDFPVLEIDLADLPELDTAYWSAPGAAPETVREIVGHIRFILEADASYPVILGFDNRVMDGMHRIAKALLAGQSSVRAVRFDRQPEPDYHGVHPDDLPYERSS